MIDSNGGNVDAAMEMGRMIRKGRLNVSVGSTSFTRCHPDQKGCKSPYQDGAFAGYSYPGFANCLSACPFILAAGTKRSVSLWSQVGIHQITTTVTKMMTRYETTYRIVKGKRKTVNTRVLNRKTTGSVYDDRTEQSRQRRHIERYFMEMGVNKTLVVAGCWRFPRLILQFSPRKNSSNTDWRRSVVISRQCSNCGQPFPLENCVLTQLKKVQ